MMWIDVRVYGIYSINVDGGAYYIEPPGLLSGIECPRHAVLTIRTSSNCLYSFTNKTNSGLSH